MQNSLGLFPIHDYKRVKQYTQAQQQHTEHTLPFDGHCHLQVLYFLKMETIKQRNYKETIHSSIQTS